MVDIAIEQQMNNIIYQTMKSNPYIINDNKKMKMKMRRKMKMKIKGLIWIWLEWNDL